MAIERFKDISPERQLKLLEDEIAHSFERCKTHWLTVAKNLRIIRDNKLYPQRKFGQYTWQKWGFKERYALQLLRSLELLEEGKKCTTVHLLLESGNISERAVRELADVPPEQREEVIEEASEGGKPPTIKSVKKAAAKRKPKPEKPERPKDRTGYEIPERLFPIWNRRNELRERLAPLHELEQWAKDMQETTDVFYNQRGFSFHTLMKEVGHLISYIKNVLPDVVCTKCQGIDPKCDFCYGRGMISKSLAHGNTPNEMKEIRDKITADIKAENDSFERLSESRR